MIAQIRAELLKLRSTRTAVGLALGMVALILLFSLLTGLLSNRAQLVVVGNQTDLLGVGGLASVFSALAGALLVTGEYRFGTIRPTLLFTPQRSRVLLAKCAASLLAGATLGVVGEGLGFGVGLATLAGRGIPLAVSGGRVTLLVLGTIAAVTIWGAIGVGIGAIIRNQVGAVIGLLAWVFVVENLLFGLVPAIGRFTPGRAEDALAGATTKHLLPAAGGGAVLVVWAVALAGLAVVLTKRRDVN